MLQACPTLETNISTMRSEILRRLKNQIVVFWIQKPCSLVGDNTQEGLAASIFRAEVKVKEAGS
jgi:hypothetical protein